jgi:hypothetical protein
MTLPFESFLNVSNKGAKAPDLPIVELWLRNALATIPEGEAVSLGDLMARTGNIEPDPDKRKKISNALFVLRKAGRVDDCFARDETRRYMGHPLILWHRPSAHKPVMNEGIF